MRKYTRHHGCFAFLSGTSTMSERDELTYGHKKAYLLRDFPVTKGVVILPILVLEATATFNT